MRQLVDACGRWIRRIVTSPRAELDRMQRALRFAYDLGRHGAAQLRRDRATDLAAALAFRTLFALVPVLIVATIVVKAMRGTEAFLKLTADLLAGVGLDRIRIVVPAGSASVDATASQTLAIWVENLINEAASVNLAAVGWIGLALIIYAAISLVVTIEDSFNFIYRAPAGRSWMRRVPLYWFVLTASPVILGVTWHADQYFSTWLSHSVGGRALGVAAGVAWNAAVIWLILFAVYTLVPNTSVALRPAAAGAWVAALLLEFGKRFLGAYLENAFAISQLYGSLGLVPLFMFWVYLMWLGVLFGLQVSATLQALGNRTLDDLDSPDTIQGKTAAAVEPAAVVSAVGLVAKSFASGRMTSPREVAERCGMSEPVAARMLVHLAERGIVNRVEGHRTAYSMARPAESVPLEDLLECGFQLLDSTRSNPPSELANRLRDAQRQAVKDVTLADSIARETRRS